MSDEKIINYPLEIPFKDFMPGQVIQSGQFNDDMAEIEEKVNEVVEKHNTLTVETDNHVSNKENPHEVTAHQVGTYSEEEIKMHGCTTYPQLMKWLPSLWETLIMNL